MKIAEFLKPESIISELSATTKAGVLTELSASLSKTLTSVSPQRLTQVLEEREKVASTGIGEGVAIPHGKLPGITVRHTYALEYGTDTIEIQGDAIDKGKRVVLVDDLLATGGTMAAAVTLLEQVGAVVPATACIIELTFLDGRKRLKPPVEALLSYDS